MIIIGFLRMLALCMVGCFKQREFLSLLTIHAYR